MSAYTALRPVGPHDHSSRTGYDIAFWHWTYNHFDGDRLERESVHFAREVMETLALILGGMLVLYLL